MFVSGEREPKCRSDCPFFSAKKVFYPEGNEYLAAVFCAMNSRAGLEPVHSEVFPEEIIDLWLAGESFVIARTCLYFTATGRIVYSEWEYGPEDWRIV